MTSGWLAHSGTQGGSRVQIKTQTCTFRQRCQAARPSRSQIVPWPRQRVLRATSNIDDASSAATATDGQTGAASIESGAALAVEEAHSSASPEVSNIVAAQGLRTADLDSDIELVELPESGGAWDRRLKLLSRIIIFTGPALSIPLGDPLMSLVDTVCIGQYASTNELAALGPNTLIFQFATYVMAALTISTTALVSEHLQAKRGDRATSILSTCLTLGAAVGLFQLVVLTVWGQQMIAATGCAVEILGPAWEYLRIRAISAPAVLVLMVAQSGLLAQKDSWTPCFGVLLQLVLNTVGDMLLIPGGGLAGAAWATVIAQWAGMAAVLWALPRKGRVKPFLSASKEDLMELSGTLGPCTAISFSKNLVYAFVQGVASALAPLQAAAHQPLYGVWNLGGFAHVPLEQAALAFIPEARRKGQGREMVGLLLGLALAVGFITAAISAGIPALLPHLFTSDASLYPLMRSVAPQAMLSLLLCSADVASGGILIASKDMRVMVRIMAIALMITTGFLVAVKRYSWGLAGVWWSLVLFFAIRAVQSLGRLVFLYGKQENAAPGNTPGESAAMAA